jgi:hypothetical protein
LNFPVQLNLDFTAQNQAFFELTRPRTTKNPNFLGFFWILVDISLILAVTNALF